MFGFGIFPLQKYPTDLVEEFLEICKGLALALKVLGGHFVGMSDKDYWKRQLKRFSTTLDEELIQNLKVSYDALKDEEKEAFLDTGEETKLAIRVLEGLYGSNIVHSLERLHQKCLVYFHYDVHSDGEIECRKPEDSPCSRLNELNISGVDDEVPSASSSSWTLDTGSSMKVSENYSLYAVQQEGAMPHLISFLKWTGFGNLCKMALTNIASLQSLPVDFGELAKLRHLDLSGCTKLTKLPKSFSKLLHLQYLALRGCSNLSIPPDILGRISTLEYADFKGCDQLVALPEGIPYQKHLSYLNLLSTCLSQLPENVEQLGNLHQLRIGSPNLTMLPCSLANMRGLTELIVIQCRRLRCLSPEGIAAPNINFLAVDFCAIANFSFQKDQQTMGVLRDLTLKRTSISEICMAEGVYPWLQTINLSENIQLKQVIALPSALVRVNLQDCWKLETLKNLSSLVNLKFLNINGCIALETLSVRGLISVEEIEAERCWKLKRIEGMNSLKCLNSLKISTDNKIFWEDVCNFLVNISVH